jgi:hypothetical protein
MPDTGFPVAGGLTPSPPPGSPAPGGTGPASRPEAHKGSLQAGLAKVSLGAAALQDSLASLPMGSDVHDSVLQALKILSKHLKGAEGGDKDSQIRMLAQMAAQRQKEPLEAERMSQLLGSGGGSPPGAGPPGGGGPPDLSSLLQG